MNIIRTISSINNLSTVLPERKLLAARPQIPPQIPPITIRTRMSGSKRGMFPLSIDVRRLAA